MIVDAECDACRSDWIPVLPDTHPEQSDNPAGYAELFTQLTTKTGIWMLGLLHETTREIPVPFARIDCALHQQDAVSADYQSQRSRLGILVKDKATVRAHEPWLPSSLTASQPMATYGTIAVVYAVWRWHASIVLASSIATLIGPTPPGTGVSHPSILSRDAASASPCT